MIPNPKGIKLITNDNWRLYVIKGIKDRMEFIENSFIS